MTLTEPSEGATLLGWLTSVCLHAMLAFGALVFTQHLTLGPRPSPFEWNVAIVRTLSTTPDTATPAVQTLAPAPSTRAGAGSRDVGGTAEAHRPLLPPSSRQAAHRQDSAMLGVPSRPHGTEQDAAVRPLEDTIPQAPRDFNDPGLASSSEFEPVTAPDPTQLASTAPDVSSATRMAATSPDPPSAGRPDYAWLSEVILRRMEELKRYPAEARLDRAEGKVVLKAVLRSNGSLEDVEVSLSSGHQSLDHAAVDLIMEAAPFQFPRPMEQSRMTIKIPMSYRLDH
jgi:periplasmic protein TonB